MFLGVFRKCFRRLFQVLYLSIFMLQLLLLDISKVYRVLHMKIWEGCRKRPTARMTSGAAWVTSGTMQTRRGTLLRELDPLGARWRLCAVKSELSSFYSYKMSAGWVECAVIFSTVRTAGSVTKSYRDSSHHISLW
jgi:hypothetical protein